MFPGAFELPLAAKWLAHGGYNAIIALGAVIRGETPHFDYVAGEAARGLQQVALETGMPGGLRRADHRHPGASRSARRRQAWQQRLRRRHDRDRDGPVRPGVREISMPARHRSRQRALAGFVSLGPAQADLSDEAIAAFYETLDSEEEDPDAPAPGRIYGDAGARRNCDRPPRSISASPPSPSTGVWIACPRWIGISCVWPYTR